MECTGITFKGIHSSEFNVIAQSVSRPFAGAVKVTSCNPQFTDGSIDISDANGRIYIEDRIFTVKFQFLADDVFALERKVAELAPWLIGKGELIYDDRPEIVYDAFCYNGGEFVPKLMGIYGEIDVNFKVKYGRKAIVTKSVALKADTATTVPVETGWYTPFTVKISGCADSTSTRLTINDFVYYDTINNIIVNMGTKEVYRGDNFYTGNSNLKFFELSADMKSINVTARTDCTATVSYEPRYLY